MFVHRRLLPMISIVIILVMLFSIFPAPTASAQGKDGLRRGFNTQTGKLNFIGPESGRALAASQALGVSSLARPADPAMALVKRFGPEFGLKNPERDLKEIKTHHPGDGRVMARYQQNYQGIPVMGGELIVNTNENGDLYSISGEITSDLSVPTQPAIDAEQARQSALRTVAKGYQKAPEDFLTSQPALWIYDESLLRPSTRPAELVWRMEVTPKDISMPVRELVLVDAQRGNISLHFNQVDTAWTRSAQSPRSSLRPQTGSASAPSFVKYEDLVVDEKRSKLYGADKVGNKVDVISMADLSVTSSFTLVYGAAPVGLDLSPDGNELAVAQSGSGLVRFINLTNNSMSDIPAPLTGSGSYATDVIYGRTGVLYALSTNGIHVIDLTLSPHQELATQYLAAEGYPYDEKSGGISSDKNTLYFVTGTCCSGYNSLNKYDVSAGLAQPALLKRTHLYNTGYTRGLRLRLIDDATLMVAGSVYNASNLTPKAKNYQTFAPATNLPGKTFYATLYNNEGTWTDRLYFYDNVTSHWLSSLDTGVVGTPGAIAATSNGNTIFVSSTGGMAKFTIGTTPPGTPVALPVSQKQYNDLAIDLARNVVYGTDVSGRIDVIDMTTTNITKSYLLPAGADPMGIDLSPTGSELAIALHGLEKILFINPTTGAKIAEVTPQLDDSIYYTNLPFDLIYGRTGRLYSSGNPSSGGIDYIHVIDTSTHTWVTKSPYPNVVRTDTEFVLNQSKTYLYDNQTFSPNNLYIYDVRTDTVTQLYQGPHGPVYADKFTIAPDGSKVFTSNGQVWDSILQSQLGTLEGAPGKLIKYIPTQNIVVLAAAGTNGDVLKFIRPTDYRLIGTVTPASGKGINEMEVAPDGSKLVVNVYGGIRVIKLDPALPASLSVSSGSNQSTAPQTAFALPLKAKVRNYLGQSLSGITVTFTAPASGASGTFANTNSAVSTAMTDANGIATSPTFTANNVLGGYTVTASISGLADTADFQLSNGLGKIETYTANNTTSLPGTFLCNQTQPNCTNNLNPHADAAHKYAIGTYNLYFTQYNRDSIDNNGMTIMSSVHYSTNYANAFWNGDMMVYGDAHDYPLADDVVAHELTHGVTQYESNLFYYYQSGAISESLSDLWGEYYDQTNGQGTDTTSVKWQIGEDASDPSLMRSMSNPTLFGDPDKMSSSNYYTGEDDSGGVHYNSGINNKAVFLMVDGGTFNGKTVTALNWVKTAAIYYEANTNLLTSGADYSDLYYALQQACSNLIGQKGITSADCAEVKDALDAVEMNSQPAPNFNTEAPYCDQGNPSATVFSDQLESGTGNWTFNNGAYPRWQLDSPYGPYAKSGLHSLYADDFPDAVTDASATLKSLVIPSNAYLRFAQAYGFETGYNTGDPNSYNFDGGVLEYSLNGGSAWLDAGSLVDYNGYTGTLFTGSGNPLSGRSAFVGSSHGYISTRLNLASLAGKTVTFRWRMGLDQASYAWGWWLDDVKVYQCPVITVNAGIYDDTHAAWSYWGPWSTYSGSGPYNNTLHQTNTAGASAEVTFNGAQIKLSYLKAPGRGSIDVYLDGTKVDTINANGSLTWQASWTSSVLAAGTHTVRFQNASTSWVDLDALQVYAADTTAPAPITSLAAVSGIGNGAVNLSWTAVGDDGTSGTATSYLVRYSTSAISTLSDWNNATVVNSGVPTPQVAGQAESMTVSGLTAGQTCYFAVRAQDEQGNLGGVSNSPSAVASTAPAIGAGTYDDTNAAWSYSGVWTTYSGAGPYNNSLHQSSTAGSYAEVRFDGVQIKLSYLKAPGRGSIDVYIDGTKVNTINANGTLTWQASWVSGLLTAGTHTVRFQNAVGGWIDLDAIQVYAAVTPVGAGTYDDTDPAWTYTGVWTTYSGSGPYNNSLHQTSTAGAYAEVTFSGIQIKLTYLKAPSRGLIDVYIDGTKVDTINANSPSLVWQASWTSGALTSGVHTVRFQNAVGGWIDLDAITVMDAVTPPTPVGAGIYDDGDPAWSYSGVWTTYTGAGPYNNSLHQSSTAGSYAEVRFDGVQIKLSYLKAPGRGSIDVYLDGTKVDTINANSPSLVWQASWTSGTLTAGTHIVRFQNAAGGWIDLDAIQVYAAVTPVGAGTYDDTHSAWTYTGTWSSYSGSGPYNNSLHQSSTAGAYAEVTFSGTQVTMTYLKASGRGMIDVYIDGTKVNTLDANSPTLIWQASWTSGTLTAGTHTVRFQNAAGGWIDLDAIIVQS